MKKTTIYSILMTSIIFSGCFDQKKSNTTEQNITKKEVVGKQVLQKKSNTKITQKREMTEKERFALIKKGNSLYLNKCSGCHGTNGDIPAFGSSKKIYKMTKDEVKKAIEGYKKGVYGGELKDIMEQEIGKLKDDELYAIEAALANISERMNFLEIIEKQKSDENTSHNNDTNITTTQN